MDQTDAFVLENGPDTFTSWRIEVANKATTPVHVQAFALCEFDYP